MKDGIRVFTPPRMRREDWIALFSSGLRSGPGEAGFHSEFVSQVVSLLKDEGFPNLGHAILCAGADAEEDEISRVEFDALVDLAIELLVGEREM